ncbi:MAG: PEP-CTERM sorting domain-containing protein [Phycisphaerae bacterium]|jgi:hypothetical protein|nr:PEP-CTERM sorting domain-containing protein [Phycisphaerae bacterium]
MKLFTKALVVALVVSCHLSLAGATVIDEISVDSVDTFYAPSLNPGTLTIAQTGVDLVLERSDNSQYTITGVDFALITYLQSDLSVAGQAIAEFTGGTISISDANNTLLTADIGIFGVEESVNLPFEVLVGSGNFTVTGGTFASEFGPNGIIFDITWKPSTSVSDFSQPFTAESDVTLTPEPATMILLATGALFAIRRRRRKCRC